MDQGGTAAERARELILQHGWNANAYQILNPGIDLWFSGSGDVVIGNVEVAGFRVIAGAPIGPHDRITSAACEFEDAAGRDGRRVVYFGIEERFARCLPPTHATLLIGAQPVWSPGDWPGMLRCHASLRQQLNRARNKGVTVSLVSGEAVRRDHRLREILDQWLRTRGLPPLHFLVEPHTLSHLEDRLVFVADRCGEPVAFLVGSPVPLRRGWLVERIARETTAPNGTSELLIDALVRSAADRGDRWVTLGLAPLTNRAGTPARDGPWWTRALFAWTRAHARRFYDFDGLERFKAKFTPATWSPVYLASASPTIDPAVLVAVARAFSGRPLLTTLTRALLMAIREETLRAAAAGRALR